MFGYRRRLSAEPGLQWLAKQPHLAAWLTYGNHTLDIRVALRCFAPGFLRFYDSRHSGIRKVACLKPIRTVGRIGNT